jgi:hypothetical protein
MATKHTHAPWVLKTRKWTNHDIDSVVESENGEQIAYFPVLKDKSNAKLIAAAPDLLEALIGMVNVECIDDHAAAHEKACARHI